MLRAICERLARTNYNLETGGQSNRAHRRGLVGVSPRLL
jgi:hypothetical protein